MAQILNETHDTKPQSPSCFLGCFGFSEKKVSEKKSLGKSESGGRKKIRWFSSSMKKRGTKTVPVDVTLSEKANQSIKNPTTKSKPGKAPSRRQIPDTGQNSAGQIPAEVSDKSIIERPHKKRYGPEQSSNLENRKHLDHLDSARDDTCPTRLSFSRKIESIRTGLSRPGSPETKPKSSTTVSARNREKRTGNTSHIHRESNVGDVGKFDPIIGMSIIMVTLIIMVFWGRLCAILCTSAWFYFVPRLRASNNSADNIKYRPNFDDVELNSEEYKRKVVLEGFLERKHRSSFGIL